MLERPYHRIAFMSLLMLFPVGAYAKSTTINDITLDVPDGYKISSSKRGILVKSPDGEVDVWVETFAGSDSHTLLTEHSNYWKKENVELGEPTTTMGKSGEADVEKTNFPTATWKGEPTVLRYSAIGPFGSQKEMLLVTYWASPTGDQQYGDSIAKMVGDINFKYPK
ncbi:MAG: hypothetical protein ACRYGP_04170 [Janthinobacterium lividum]